MKESIVQIGNYQYRYGYDSQSRKTVYLGPVGSAPALSEEEFQRALLKKGKWVRVENEEDKDAIRNHLYMLVEATYGPIGGHPKILTPDNIDLYDIWYVLDYDQDDLPDITILGKERAGVKMGAVGHDQMLKSKTIMKDELANKMKTEWWAEMSGPISAAMIKQDVPYVEDPEVIKEALEGRDFTWYGKHPHEPDDSIYNQVHGWYGRKIGGKERIKIMLGVPML